MGLDDNQKFDRLLSGVFWFVLGFALVLFVLIVFRPPFFLSLVNPALIAVGIHPLWGWLRSTVDFLFSRFGIFFVFALILVFWWIFFRGIKEQKDRIKKQGEK
ncbi:MAG: hypothetical protein V1777_04885 [Candidatus Micrarchaeota archaeon]